MDRVSSFGLTRSLLAATMALQARMAEKQVQQASELVSDTYAGLGAKAGTLVSLESEMTRLTTWSENTQTALDRVEAMYEAVDGMADIASSLRSTLSAALSSTSETTSLNETGAGLLEDLADLMNLRQDGRYLFAGGQTTIAPVPDEAEDYPAPSIPSSADTSYYTGDSSVAEVRVSASQSVSYGVTADNAAFEKVLRAAAILANLTTDPLDETAVQEAYDLATEALDDLLAVQGSLSVTASRFESALERQESAIAAIEESVTDIKSVDVAEIAVTLAEYETILQASYSALATVSKLSLTDYL